MGGAGLMAFTFHEDDAHGWLEVPLFALVNMGMRMNSITPFSYIDRNKDYMPIYLEEDVDMQRFVKHYEEYHGKRLEIGNTVTYAGSAPIRELPSVNEED